MSRRGLAEQFNVATGSGCVGDARTCFCTILNLGRIGRSVIGQDQLERLSLVLRERKRVRMNDRFVNLAQVLQEPVSSGVGLDKGICVVKVE